MNEELKPCPFCGKECYHVQYKDGMKWCFNCLHCPMEYYTDIEDEQEAIKAFNTRHQPPQANEDKKNKYDDMYYAFVNNTTIMDIMQKFQDVKLSSRKARELMLDAMRLVGFTINLKANGQNPKKEVGNSLGDDYNQLSKEAQEQRRNEL